MNINAFKKGRFLAKNLKKVISVSLALLFNQQDI